jgi:hypothetical protein
MQPKTIKSNKNNMEDNLFFYENGRRPNFFQNGRQTQKNNATKNN